MAFHCFNIQKCKHVKLTGRGRYLLRDYRTKFSSCKFRAGISHEIRWRDPHSVFLERARATHQFLGNYVVGEDEYQIAPQVHPSTVTSVMFNSILSLFSNIVWKLTLKIFNTWVLFQFLFTCWLHDIGIFFLFLRDIFERHIQAHLIVSRIKKNKYYSPCFSPINSKMLFWYKVHRTIGGDFLFLFSSHTIQKFYLGVKFIQLNFNLYNLNFLFLFLQNLDFIVSEFFFYPFLLRFKILRNPRSFSFCFEIDSKCWSHRCESMPRNA